MRHAPLRAGAALALLLASTIAFASAPVPVVMGPSREGSLEELQAKVDHFLGPGRVNVRTDFLGAHPGDPDPWFWVNNGARVISLTLIDRKSPHGEIGWYKETGSRPVIDGVDDGVVLEDLHPRGRSTVVHMPASVSRYGFYVVHQGGDEKADEGHSTIFFTNRLFNDVGPYGRGGEHEPYDGDVQMLIFDVSRWLGADTWLVACEYSDSGSPVGQNDGQSDNDFSDILYTVTGLGATPIHATSFGRLKALYR